MIKETENHNKGSLIKAGIYMRPNAMNGKYKAGQLGLDSLVDIKDSNIFFLETLRMKADFADKMIAEAESQGKDTSDPKVMQELGKKINAVGTPLRRSEAVMTAIFASLQIMVYYGVAMGIWGLVFERGFLTFGLYGIGVGLLISLLSAAPVIAFQRTKGQIRNIVDGVSNTWGNLGIIIGSVGLIALVIRLIFY